MANCITWKDFYSVGEPSLDAEHKHIIGILNELVEAVELGSDHEILKSVLDRLVQYTMTHFKHEEEVMQEHDYPDFQRHKGLHDRLRQRTIDLRDNITLVTGHDMLFFLKQWWMGHIQGEDKKYSPYVEFSTSRR
jgi:hemerythrin-like metal-binding protein